MEIGIKGKFVVIAENAALIVIAAESELMSFGVNGDFVKQVGTLKEMLDMRAIDTRAGIDFLAVVEEGGVLVVRDAETLLAVKVVFQMPMLKSVRWNRQLNAMAVTGDGRIVVVLPFEIA